MIMKVKFVEKVKFIPSNRPNIVIAKILGKVVRYRVVRKMISGGIGTWNEEENIIYVEPNLPPRTEKAVLVHEAVESFLEKVLKFSDEDAHRIAVIEEHRWLRGEIK
jgi:Zn-dependent peptidase ImmA (M78 family)